MAIKSNKKILIVEDDPDFQDILQTGFGADPLFSLVLAKDGEEGLNLALQEKPDLIVLDILMPKMDGVEVAKKLREKSLAAPIIFFTNVSDASGIDRAFSVSNSRYVVKASMHINDMIKTVKDMLGMERE